MLTNRNLLKTRSYWEVTGFGGNDSIQRIYCFKNGHGLSAVNEEKLHSYRFAWEIVVLSGLVVYNDGNYNWDRIDYTTELTSDVEVFLTDEEANTFIEKALLLLGDYDETVNKKERVYNYHSRYIVIKGKN